MLRKPKYFFFLCNPWIEDQFSNRRGAYIIFCFTSHNLCPWKTTHSFPRANRSPKFNSPLFFAAFTFIAITYVTRYKKNRWHSCSEPTYHGQISSQLSPKIQSYINARYTVKKITWIWTSVLLNAPIEYQHFKMESLACAIQLMKKNCFMASIDLTDTYYTVPVAVEPENMYNFSGEVGCFNTHVHLMV